MRRTSRMVDAALRSPRQRGGADAQGSGGIRVPAQRIAQTPRLVGFDALSGITFGRGYFAGVRFRL